MFDTVKDYSYNKLNEANICSTNLEFGRRSKQIKPLLVRTREYTRKREMGISKFGVLTQIWPIGPHLNILCHSIFNVDNKKVFIC